MPKWKHRFTKKEDKIIKRLALKMTYSEIAIKLGVERYQVKRRAYHTLGIRIKKDEIKRRQGTKELQGKVAFESVVNRIMQYYRLICKYHPERKKEVIKMLSKE